MKTAIQIIFLLMTSNLCPNPPTLPPFNLMLMNDENHQRARAQEYENYKAKNRVSYFYSEKAIRKNFHKTYLRT